MSERMTFGVELRGAPDGRELTGLAVPYGTVSLLSPFPDGEQFARGAFKRTADHMGGRLPKLFRNHDWGVAVGTAVEMRETDAGLMATWRIADTPAGNAALQEIREGVLDSLSVGFRAIREGKVGRVREVREAHLLEVSLVPMPVYEDARVMSLREVDPAARVMVPPRPDFDPNLVLRIGESVW
jgi:HK97 family phage prohead protease